VSPYVARAASVIRDSGLAHALGPMGTTIEGEWEQVMALVEACFRELEQDCDRVYLSLKIDYRKGPAGRLAGKVDSLRRSMGE